MVVPAFNQSQFNNFLIINSGSKVYLQLLIKTFALKFIICPKMPKSVSTLENQIAGCEKNIQEALAQCAVHAGDNNFSFTFSLKDFVDDITSVDIEATSASIEKVLSIFQGCEKITRHEKKRRGYVAELKKFLETRERRNTVKRLTMHHRFNRKASHVKIPTSQDDM